MHFAQSRSAQSLHKAVSIRVHFALNVARTRHGLSTAGVGDADELVEEDRVLVVVPVTENNRELFVVLVLLLRRVDNYRCAKTIDVLTLCKAASISGNMLQITTGITYVRMRVNPVRAPLVGLGDLDGVVEALAGRDTTKV